MSKEKVTNILLGSGIGLIIGLIIAFGLYSSLSKTIESAKKELGQCYTVGKVVEKIKLNVEDYPEVKEAIEETDKNIKVCLSEDYANKLEESLKDVDLSDYSIEDLEDLLLGGIGENVNLETPEFNYSYSD